MNHFKRTREICPVGLEEIQRHSLSDAVIKYKQWKKRSRRTGKIAAPSNRLTHKVE